MSLGENIRVARERAGLTQSELADRLGRSRTAVNEWETGKRTPRSTVRVRAVLGVDEDWQSIPNDSPGSYAHYTSNELVTQIRLLAAELGRRAEHPDIAIRPGAEEEIRQRPGSRRIDLPESPPTRNRRSGTTGSKQSDAR